MEKEKYHKDFRELILSEDFKKLMAYYQCAMMEVETKFNVLNEECSLTHERNPISSIKARIKTAESIFNKLIKLGVEPKVENIEKTLNDVAGVRVICNFEDDVYMLAQSLLMQDDINLIIKKDYIDAPKPNGYRSLHLIVSVPIFLQYEKREMKVEIQIRTLAMDCWATIEHQLRYKKNVNFTDEMSKELLICAKLGEEMDKRMESIRKEVF